MSKTIITSGETRLNYLHVFEPYAQDGGKEKYSACLIIPKTDKKTLAFIQHAIKGAYEDGIEDGTLVVKGKTPSLDNLKSPLRDGDEERPDEEIYEDCYFMNASSKYAPTLLDENGSAIEHGRTDLIYSGVYAQVRVTFYAYNVKGKTGISASLSAIKRSKDGECLTKGIDYDAEFKAAEEEELPFN